MLPTDKKRRVLKTEIKTLVLVIELTFCQLFLVN